MAFTFSKTTPATGSVAMYEFKEHLKSQGWTVPESSDGTTYNNAGDQITTGASGAGGMANTNAWFRIQSPAGAASNEFVVQRGSTNVGWRIKHSRAAGFTGGSPSATQVPSATDEGLLWGAGTDASPTFSNLFTTDNTYRWNVGADAASPYGFWAGAFPTGGGDPTTGFVFDPLTGAEPTDGHLYAIYVSGSGGAPFINTSLYTESFAATSNALWAMVAATSPTIYAFMTAWVLFSPSVGLNAVPNGLSTNPITNKDEMFPLVLGRRGAQTNPGYKGITTLMKWTGTARTTGDTLTWNTSRDRIIYKHVSLPWDGTVPTV